MAPMRIAAAYRIAALVALALALPLAPAKAELKASASPATNIAAAYDAMVYTPTSCDGVHFGGGSVTASSTNFHNTQISATAAAVGRTLVVEGAGAAGATYAGTITAVPDATDLTVSPAFGTTVSGAGFSYGSIYTSQIQAKLDAGGEVRLPPTGTNGGCGIDATLTLANNAKITGLGGGGQFPPKSALLWLSASNTPVLKIDNGTQAFGVDLANFTIFGFCGPSDGISEKGLQGAVWNNVHVYDVNTTGVGFHFDVSADGNFDTGSDLFTNLHAAVQNVCAAGMTPIRVEPGNTNHELTRSTFVHTYVQNDTGTGLDLYGINSTVWLNTRIVPVLAASGLGARFHGASTANENAHANTFTGFESGGAVQADAGTFPAINNTITGFDTSTYLPTITVASGASLFCTRINGDTNYCTPHDFGKKTPSNPAGVTDTAAYHMFGLAGSFTPNVTSKETITVTGNMTSNTLGDGGAVLLYYDLVSNEAAPANGAAVPGTATQCGGFPVITNAPNTTSQYGFTLTCNLTPLTQGAAYWFDVAGKATGAGSTFSINNAYMSHAETP